MRKDNIAWIYHRIDETLGMFLSYVIVFNLFKKQIAKMSTAYDGNTFIDESLDLDIRTKRTHGNFLGKFFNSLIRPSFWKIISPFVHIELPKQRHDALFQIIICKPKLSSFSFRVFGIGFRNR